MPMLQAAAIAKPCRQGIDSFKTHDDNNLGARQLKPVTMAVQSEKHITRGDGGKEYPSAGILRVTNAPPMYKSVEELTAYFGDFGGRFIPETLMEAHTQLEQVRGRAEIVCAGKLPVFAVFADHLPKVRYSGYLCDQGYAACLLGVSIVLHCAPWSYQHEENSSKPWRITHAMVFPVQAYVTACQDPAFREEFEQLGKDFIGRPTPMYHAKRLSAQIGGAQVRSPHEPRSACHSSCFPATCTDLV